MTTLDKPRWPGGPAICATANLPALDSKKALHAFKEANAPGGTVIEEWCCTACGHWHYWGSSGDPSGASSGTTRSAKHIDSLRYRFLKTAAARTRP